MEHNLEGQIDDKEDEDEDEIADVQRKSLFSSSMRHQVPSTSLNNKCRVETEMQGLDDNVMTPQDLF